MVIVSASRHVLGLSAKHATDHLSVIGKVLYATKDRVYDREFNQQNPHLPYVRRLQQWS